MRSSGEIPPAMIGVVDDGGSAVEEEERRDVSVVVVDVEERMELLDDMDI